MEQYGDIDRLREVEVPCVLNIAAVKLKTCEYDEVIEQCNKVLHAKVGSLQVVTNI